MKRVLIVTSRLAYKMVLNEITRLQKQLKHKYVIDIIKLPIDVIALANPKFLEHNLKRINIKNYDYVIIPGTVKHDLTEFSRRIGVKIIKSPSKISLLRTMFIIGLDKFSPKYSGDTIIRKNLKSLLKKAYEYYMSINNGIRIKETIIPYVPPPFIIGFYLHHKWGKEWLGKYINVYKPNILYIPSGSYEDLIDYSKYIDLHEYIIAIPPDIIGKNSLGVDAQIIYGLSPSQIHEYIDSGYVLQINVKDPREIDKIIDKWGKTDKIIYNLVFTGLNEERLIETLYNIRRYNNVVISTWITTLSSSMDVDSHSIHAFLLKLFKEAGISLIVINEFEEKLFWSLREISISNDLITLSSYLDVPPRDFGIDMLYIKDKEYYDIDLGKPDKIIIAEKENMDLSNNGYKLDPYGIFKIKVNHKDDYIEAMYIGRKGKILIKGKSEEAIRKIILREKLVSSMSHAFYLGRELGKAEEALRIGKNYEQEKPLFKKPGTF